MALADRSSRHSSEACLASRTDNKLSNGEVKLGICGPPLGVGAVI